MALIKNKDADAAANHAIVLDLGDLKEQARRIHRDAEQRAEKIVAEAHEEARRLTEGAEQRGYEAGYEKGRAEGHEVGRKEGHDAALQQTSEKLQQLQDAWIQAAQQWDAERQHMVAEARESLLTLSIELARRIVHRVPHVDPAAVQQQVTEAIEHVARPCDATITIHPDDRPLVEQALPQIIEATDRVQHAALAEDASIQRGGCIVTAGQGRIDAQLDTQLDRLVASLLPEHGQSEQQAEQNV